MGASIVNATVASAWGSASSQTAQLAAPRDALGDDWVARIEGTGGALRRTQTYDALTISTTEPRSMVIGQPLTDTPVSEGDIVRVVMRSAAGVDIIVADAQSGSGPAAIDFAPGGIKTACRPTLAGVTFTANAGLPLVSLPTWRVGQSLLEWREIANTQGTLTGLTQRSYDAYNGWAVRQDTAELIAAAYGGHDDGNDNRVTSVSLLANAPTWTTRTPASPTPTRNSAYAADGKPGSRHVYTHNHYSAAAGRLFMVGARFVWGDGPPQYPTVDAWDPTASAWEAAGSVPDVPSGGGYGVVQVSGGKIWTPTGRVLDTVTRTWSTVPLSWSGATPSWAAVPVRFPAAYDSLRDRIFHLQWGDSQGFDTGFGMVAFWRNPTTGVGTPITWSSGSASALAQFAADAPAYPGMEYDPGSDKFYFCAGSPAGRVYVITPSTSGDWQMSILSTTGATPGAAPISGVNGHWRYVASLGGIAYQPSAASNIFFLRTV